MLWLVPETGHGGVGASKKSILLLARASLPLSIGAVFIGVLSHRRLAHLADLSAMHPRTVFSGPARKFILGIDIGTTYAGMSYWYVPLLLYLLHFELAADSFFSLLEPGRIPEILPVTQ